MKISSQKQKRIEKLESRITWIDTMLEKPSVSSLDKTILANEKNHWLRTIPVIIDQPDY